MGYRLVLSKELEDVKSIFSKLFTLIADTYSRSVPLLPIQEKMCLLFNLDKVGLIFGTMMQQISN